MIQNIWVDPKVHFLMQKALSAFLAHLPIQLAHLPNLPLRPQVTSSAAAAGRLVLHLYPTRQGVPAEKGVNIVIWIFLLQLDYEVGPRFIKPGKPSSLECLLQHKYSHTCTYN